MNHIIRNAALFFLHGRILVCVFEEDKEKDRVLKKNGAINFAVK